MLKHETIEVDGTALYCDVCRARGPESAYDNQNDTYDMARQDGWRLDDQDVCPTCVRKVKAARRPKMR